VSSAILTVQKSTSIERRIAISLDADRRQERVIRSVLSGGFDIDWTRVLNIGYASDPVAAIERRIREELASDEFRDTITALVINGRLLASFIQLKHERLIGAPVPDEVPVAFAEELAVFKPSAALEFWRELLGLTDDQIRRFEDGLGTFQTEAASVRGRLTDAIVKKLTALHEETIGTGLSQPDFVQRAQELLPNSSRAMLEAEYRTELTKAYGGARHELIVSRSNAFPFTQFFAVVDARTTWDICLPMGTAGPGGKGYIAASSDPIWFIWRPPNHWQCRSDLSPIGYRECIRLGILDAQGRKIALVGNNPDRPFGDPPSLATEEGTGTIRRVEPQNGFGA
jgi:hypothetical protein